MPDHKGKGSVVRGGWDEGRKWSLRKVESCGGLESCCSLKEDEGKSFRHNCTLLQLAKASGWREDEAAR